MRVTLAPACRACRPSSCWGSACFPTAKAPHFSRLGDVEVNAGQNASFQCMAAGRAAEAERFFLQVRVPHVDLAREGSRGPFASSAWFPFGVLSPLFIHQHLSTLCVVSPRLCSASWDPLNLRVEACSRILKCPGDSRDSHTLPGWNAS